MAKVKLPHEVLRRIIPVGEVAEWVKTNRKEYANGISCAFEGYKKHYRQRTHMWLAL